MKRQLKDERKRFIELDQEKTGYWLAKNLQEYERVKRAWQDSAQQINYLHRLLYPYFPYSGTCYNCGSDLLPVLGGNPTSMDKCVACGQVVSRW